MIDKSRFVIAAMIAFAAAVAGVATARRRFLIIDVTGDSMGPSLVHGDRLLVHRTRRFRVGSIVVAHHQQGRPRGASADPAATAWLVKRVAALPGDPVPESVAPAVGGHSRHVPDGMTVLLGENSQSIDSRLWGFVPLNDIEGVVVKRLSSNSRCRVSRVS
ncbi:S26 family signal peptidase [Micromonospora sp. CPCC 206061]|uniref:S26 family signal peptidase n=1 Tax=Micromonospora sp. CPCC 206061 TaxID=3122410 RepID=UPI002FF29827